ncbi:alpha/beta fold hydrolase [Vagococcus elongatus]|uniref:Alpha/beta hydrolase n=1 Tax=Vagococcus elongatus TaxID=180344 RepID=A0A430AZJ9_9ENTE|nr:alpha/beta hydrolase [Vagococcus elongatus]RSU13474.1 alpha/beta hydrolase [Vagococcus elongatus]
MKKHFSFLSQDNKTDLHGMAWIPEEKPHGVLQIVHGMAEYIERYEPLANYLNQMGWLVVGHDHLGHGDSVTDPKDYGFFTKKDSDKIVVEDTFQLTTLTKEKYPQLPYFILGHSMGSFIVRNYLKTHSSELTGAILMGTGSYKKELKLVLPMLKQLNKIAPKKVNPTMDKLVFGNFSKAFPEKQSSFNWLSKNQTNVTNYEADPKLGFIFTNNGFYTLLKLMASGTKEYWSENISEDLAILIISGERDPVGDFGKGPRKTAIQLQQHGVHDLTLHLYHELRHEILHEEEKELIMSDIAEWMEVRV